MDKEKYALTQITIIQIGRIANGLELEEFIAQIGKAEAVAPLLDPTLYRKGAANLSAIKALAEAILPVKAAFAKMFETVVKTAVENQHPEPAKE